MPSAIAHYLNCLLGTSLNPNPTATPAAIPDDLFTTPTTKPSSSEVEYTRLTPESLRQLIIAEVGKRFRWTLTEEYLSGGLRKKQLMRELGLRLGWQLLRRDYVFEPRTSANGDEGKEKSKKEKKRIGNGIGNGKVEKKEVEGDVTFRREDVLCLVPIVKGTAPSVSYYPCVSRNLGA